VRTGETIRLVPSARQAAVNPTPHDPGTLGHIGDRIRTRLGESAAGRAAAFGIPAVTVDGMDAEAVHAATARAVAAAREGSGPALIECLTYRYGPHHTIELRVRLSYRSQEEIERWRQRDPLDIQGARIPAAERDQIDAEIADVILAAEEYARSSPEPDPAGALDHLYASGLTGRDGMI